MAEIRASRGGEERERESLSSGLQYPPEREVKFPTSPEHHVGDESAL